MSKTNLLFFLNNYSDTASSNSPSLSNFKWNRQISSIPSQNGLSEQISLAPGESKTIFDGSRTLLHDNTTEYSIALKPLSSNTYVLTAVAGTMPKFRTPRIIGSDATTAVSVTVNGPLAVFQSTAGTDFNFSTVVVGDFVRLGSVFNASNQGEFKILSKTSDSVTVELSGAVSESNIVLSSGFADQFQVYSAAGVQIDDTIIITGGFSEVTQGSYEITDVAANYLEFYSTSVLPEEANVLTMDIDVYSAAKQLIYVETDNLIELTINDTQQVKVEPFIINDTVCPGVFLIKSTIYSLNINNISTNTASIFNASIE